MDKQRCNACNVNVKSLYYHNKSQLHKNNVANILESSMDPKDQEINRLRKLISELQEALRCHHMIFNKS